MFSKNYLSLQNLIFLQFKNNKPSVNSYKGWVRMIFFQTNPLPRVSSEKSRLMSSSIWQTKLCGASNSGTFAINSKRSYNVGIYVCRYTILGWNDFFYLFIWWILISCAGKGQPFWPLKAIKATRPKKAKTFFCKMTQNGLKWREMWKKIPVMTFLAFARFSHKCQWPFDSSKLIFMTKDSLY